LGSEQALTDTAQDCESFLQLRLLNLRLAIDKTPSLNPSLTTTGLS